MLIKIIIFIVILACAGPFFISGPDGEPLMTLDDLMPAAPDVPDIVPAAPVTVYKWQDENGIWQFSTEPVEGAETMELDGQVTVMDSLDPKDLQRLSGESTAKPAAFKIPSGVTTVAPDQVEKMMESVNSMQDTVDERKQEIDRRTKQP